MAQSEHEGETPAIDYSRCPLPKTHRRLVEAHLLWHQTLAQYQQPDLFQANLNATIQALRNITFVLQSEKHSFNQFEEWYGCWQERMKTNPVLRWLKDARNTVVKQGELETASTALVKLVAWKDYVLAESSVAPDTPPSLILRNIPLFELVNSIHLSPGDLENAVIVIERRWSVPDLEGREILEALAEAYGLLSDIVLDAHVALGETSCIPSEGAHVHFRSAYHRSGTLACMTLGVDQRTHSFSLSTGQPIQNIGMIELTADPLIAEKRYKLEQTMKISKWQVVDPLLVAERLLFAAKRMLRKDKVIVRVLFVRDGRGAWHQVVLNASNRMEKNLLMQMVSRFIESVGGDAIVDVGEVWTLQLNSTENSPLIDHIKHSPDRGEALSVLVATREGILRTYMTPFTRGPFGGIKLGDTVQTKDDRPYYLKPVFDVWQTQGTTYSPDGKRIRRLWEPDPLDTCFCGGPRRFAECCKRLLDTFDRDTDLQQKIDEATTARDFIRFENLARAALAQYVIWVKRDTSPTRHVAPDAHRMFVEIDMPALDAHVRQMGAALTINGHSDSFLYQLRHITRVIGVPELSVRITGLAAQWLLVNGDYVGAVKELETLGDLEKINDTLVLILSAKLFELPVHKQRQFLNRAVLNALWEKEKWLAELELIRHLSYCNEKSEALRKVDSVIAGLMENDTCQGLRADAMSLRWNITNEEQDFRAAKSELERFTDPEHRHNLAVILIDHGDYDEAERILSEELTTGDPMAQLLIVDARVRAKRSDSAQELLLNIAPDRVATHLQYPYAVAFAIVALACEDDDLKKLAATRLRQLPAVGTRVSKDVNDLLEVLEEREDVRRESVAARFGGLFLRKS